MLGQIIPIIDICKPNRVLREKNIEIPESIETIDIKFLENDYNATVEAKNKFEDKAKTIVATLMIAITLILNLSKIIDTVVTKFPIGYFRYFIFILAILAILYMIMAGIMSIQVLIKENLLYQIPLEKRTDRKSIFQSTQKNINQNLIRNNIIYASYISIRNSVICLLIIFGLAVFPYQKVNNIESTKINTTTEVTYGNAAVEWLINNSQKAPDFDKIIESYKNICNDGRQMNIYDKNQGIIVTIEAKNNSYFISAVIDNITEIK